jgi:hypothetical protein
MSNIPNSTNPSIASSSPFTRNSNASSNVPPQSPAETIQTSCTTLEYQNSPTQSDAVSPSTTIVPEDVSAPFSKPYAGSASTVVDSTAVIQVSKHLSPRPSSDDPQSIDIEHSADSDESSLYGEEPNFNDGDALMTDSASPLAQTPSSTILNDSIEGAGPIHDPTVQASRKRRMSQSDIAVGPPRSKTFRRTTDRKFRKASPDSMQSTADIEIGHPAEASTSIGDSLGVGMTVKDELAGLRMLARTRSSECLLRKETEQRRLRLDHLDKLYTLDTDRYFCHACLYVLLLCSSCHLVCLDRSPIHNHLQYS